MLTSLVVLVLWAVTTIASDIIDLDVHSFYSFREEHKDKDLVVQFWTDKSDACKSFEPIYADFASKYSNKVYAARVDVVKNKMVPVMFGLDTYPTLRLYDAKENVGWEYTGPGNTADEIGQWATSAKTDEGDGIPPPLTDEDEAKFQKIMKMMQTTGLVDADGLPRKERKAGGSGGDDSEEKAVADGPSSVIVLDDDWKQTITSTGGTWLIEFYAPWCGHCKSLAPIYEELAATIAADGKTDIHIAKVDATVHKKAAETFAVTGFPSVVVPDLSSNTFYDFSGARTVEDMRAFVEGDYKTGEAKELQLPIELTGPRVVQTIGDNNATLLETGTWFVEFYAPWCGHCQKLEPIFEMTARELQAEGVNVKFAAVDVIANTACNKRFAVESFPTLYRLEDGTMIKYPRDAERTKADLKKFNIEANFEGLESQPIPAPPTLMDEINEVLEITKKDLLLLWDLKKLAIGIIFAAGVVVGAFLVAILTPTPKPRKRPAQATKPTTKPKAQ